MEILRYYDTLFEAEVVRSRLESEGVMAIVQNENMGSVIPVMGVVQSFKPYIVVRHEDFMRATEILGINVSEEEKVCQCPDCKSEDIAFRFFCKDKPMKPLVHFIMLPLLLLSVHSGNIRRAYICRKCGNWF
jgi:hypothetical protein